MYIPITHSHTTVINKTIVYSDTVLNLKDLGDNIKVTSISNVSEYELEHCLEVIFESNPNVVFNTIQYSRNDKKVYFYTDKIISKKEYEESKFTKYKPITSKSEILEETKKVLLSPQSKDDTCISLYDVATILRKFRGEFDSIKKRYKNKFDNIIRWNFGEESSIIIHDFDYEKKLLNIGFHRYSFSDFDEIYFAKENGDLYIVKSESCYSQEIFKVLGSYLSDLYDELLEYADYKDYKNSKYHIKAINSNFEINISHYGVSICVRNLKNPYIYDVELTAHSYENDYELDCNSNLINEAILGKENEIFRRIFVKISDCPEWSQEELYNIRQKQLYEEKRLEEERISEARRIEDEIKYKEMKKQKRLELVRKFNPFRKKEK